jgi:hypothetical protein
MNFLRMNAPSSFLLLFVLSGLIIMISARYIDPNCGWSDETYRAVGAWAIDAGSSSHWSLTEPRGLTHPTNANSCEYTVDIHGLKVNKQYQ